MPAMENNPRYIEVESSLEFSRLVCALEPVPRISFLHEHNGRQVISIQMDVLNNRPIVYYTPLEARGRYLSYRIKGRSEESGIVDSTKDTTSLYSPIIKVKRLPDALKPGSDAEDQYLPFELEDLDSLAKLSYGVENASFPLFAFPSEGLWVLGAFMNFNDDEEAYFCYVALPEDPKKPYLRHSTQDGEGPSFVDHTMDHGYSYIKIIRLKDAHPLVRHEQLQN